MPPPPEGSPGGASASVRRNLTVQSLTVEEHREWAQKLWNRMDRDASAEITVEELNCDEFQVVLRSIMAPLTAGKGVAGYERSEINLPQALAYCVSKADKNNDGVLDFKEFEYFMRFLRNERSPEHITNVIYALFDLDGDQFISQDEFREIYRYFLGHHPTAVDFHREWTALDPGGTDCVTKPQYAKWLRKFAGPVFRQHAPPVIGSAPSSDFGDSSAGGRRSPKKSPIFRPAPGVLPPREGARSAMDDAPPPIWNSRFNAKDPSEQNLAFRGNLRMKTMFSRPQSLPELHRFYSTYQGFEKNRQKLCMPETAKKKRLVLSTDTVYTRALPGASRHEPGGTMCSSSGDVVPWRENTPRALIRPKWEPGSLLLRSPGPPAPFLALGRGGDED